MDDVIVCPNCGETNPADMPICHNCQWRLRTWDDDWERKHPAGSHDPSAESTGDDSVPEWLRLAKAQPRPERSAEEAAADRLRERLSVTEKDGEASGNLPDAGHEDLLAGLAHAEQPDDEPIPDWVASIMGITETDAYDESPPDPFGIGAGPGSGSQTTAAPFDAGAGGALRGEPGKAGQAPHGDKGRSSGSATPATRAGTSDQGHERADIYEWLRKLDADQAAPVARAARRDIPATTDVPTWVGRMMGVTGEAAPDAAESDGSVPDWLSETSPPAGSGPSSVGEKPSEVPAQPEAASGSEYAREPKAASAPPAYSFESEAANASEYPREPQAAAAPEYPVEPEAANASEYSREPQVAAATEYSIEPEALDASPVSLKPTVQPPAESVVPPESRASAVKAADDLDVDAVFAAMQMPAWAEGSESAELSGAAGGATVARGDEPIELAELPSWVKAMRPVESAAAATETQQPETPREPLGPLIGLGSVLPAIPGAAVPSLRPSSQEMKLSVSDQHRAHASLLEQLLEAETRPLLLQRADRLTSPNALRWLIGAVLLAGLTLSLISGSTSFAFPSAVPAEANAAIQVVQSLAPDAPVLAVFDYEPATAGEMEVTAAPIMDQLLLLKHPRLALISTSPTGSALAERFISTALQERAYVRGTQYVDLGYLPGGPYGIQFFAQDAISALPFGAGADLVWQSNVVAGIAGLADFGAIILLTDSLESGSVWIEQTTGLRGHAPMLIVASAQAGPMLLPYFDAGQVQGLIVGINGAVGAEVANGGRPGLVRTYWDAYNLGLYMAAAIVALGAIWQVIGRFRRRWVEAR